MNYPDTFITELRDKGPDMGLSPELVIFYEKLFSLQFKAEDRYQNRTLQLTEETIDKRLAERRPLIDPGSIGLNWDHVNETYRKVLSLFGRYTEIVGELPSMFLAEDTLPPISKSLVEAWLIGKIIPPSIGIKTQEDSLFFASVLHCTMKPYLTAAARVFQSYLPQQKWRNTCCPVCHGIPDIGYLHSETGAMWLVCSRCDTEWLFQRLRCPHCGTQDQGMLSYFPDEKEVYRLHVCDNCRRYIKIIDLRKAPAGTIVTLERVLTLAIDHQAGGMGYRPGEDPKINGT